jgi:hypothetical protein
MDLFGDPFHFERESDKNFWKCMDIPRLHHIERGSSTREEKFRGIYVLMDRKNVESVWDMGYQGKILQPYAQPSLLSGWGMATRPGKYPSHSS